MWEYLVNLFSSYSFISSPIPASNVIDFSKNEDLAKLNALHIESWYLKQKHRQNHSKWLSGCQNNLSSSLSNVK